MWFRTKAGKTPALRGGVTTSSVSQCSLSNDYGGDDDDDDDEVVLAGSEQV